jgi:hypothetical protein
MTSLQAALAGCLMALVVVGAFLAIDKGYLHWYAEEDSSSQIAALDAKIADLQTRMVQTETGLSANGAADAGMSVGLQKFELDYLPLFDDIAKKLSCTIGVPMGPPRMLVCP